VTLQLMTSLISFQLFGVGLTIIDPQLSPTTYQSCRYETCALELHRTYDFLTRLRDEFELMLRFVMRRLVLVMNTSAIPNSDMLSY
jgi:hypothetical protein